MSIRHDPRTASYIVTVGEAQHTVTYDRGAAGAKREAWQFACELEAELEAKASAAASAAAVAEANAAVAHEVSSARGYEPDAEELAEAAAWLAEIADAEAATSTPAAREGYTLPAAELVAACLVGLRQSAGPAEARALDKAAYEVSRGSYAAAQVAGDGALLVPSRSGGGVYRVDDAGCSCPAGEHGRPCWHRHGLYAAVLVARDAESARLDDEAEYRWLTQRAA